MTGVRSGKEPAQIVTETLAACPPPPDARKQLALSPHSLYATRPELLQLAAAAAADRGWLLTTHVAESREEFDMFAHRRGRLHDWLASQRELGDCDGATPVECLERLAVLSPRLLAVHVNCLGPGDAERLARAGTHVVHCPRSHAYFQHPPFPLAELTAAGVNLCLGTDSLASVRGTNRSALELNLFKEMQVFADNFPEVPPERIVQLSTINGARALGRSGELGEIAPGAAADLIALPWSGALPEIFEAIVRNQQLVIASYVAGERVDQVAGV
jgi:aminodeoxyfutalosine deaminase